jgi:hypothetical protein
MEPFFDPRLTDALSVIPWLAYAGLILAVIATVKPRASSRLHRLVATQRRRYITFGLGMAMHTACAVWLLVVSQGSVGDIASATKYSIESSAFGWMAAWSVAIAALTPLVVLAGLLRIRLVPVIQAQ